jgi:hypothetical protein
MVIITTKLTYSQNIENYEFIQHRLSSSEKRFYDLNKTINTYLYRQFYKNPAFHNLNSLDFKLNSYLSVNYSKSKLYGDYITAEGNEFEDFRICAAAYKPVTINSTLSGHIQLSRGIHKNISWNTARDYDLYSPYISTDSIGGDFKFKEYLVFGNYAFNISKFSLGINAYFKGERAHRETDPRCLNTSSCIGSKLGIMKQFSNNILAAKIGIEKNKQHITMRYWRPGQQERFFVARGLGLYDEYTSRVSFGYSRMYYLKSYIGGLTYISDSKNTNQIRSDIEYKFSKMKTEESIIRDLYEYKNHELSSSINFKHNFNKRKAFSISIISEFSRRIGYENIFINELVDKKNNIYDYKNIDIQKNYELLNFNNNISIDYTINKKDRSEFKFISGIDSKYRKENHKENYITNSSINPYISLNYKLKFNDIQLYIKPVFKKKFTQKNNYNITYPKNTNIEYLEFQHAFNQYAYYNSEWNALSLDSKIVKDLLKYKLGIGLKLMYIDGNRDKNTNYTKGISFNSRADLINSYTDKHNEKWISFYIFILL